MHADVAIRYMQCGEPSFGLFSFTTYHILALKTDTSFARSVSFQNIDRFAPSPSADLP
jgi:hypothetical protein